MRTVAKALTYRILSLAVTATIGFVLTGSLAAALSVGVVDALFKLALYSAHEAAWNRITRSGLAGAAVALALYLTDLSREAAYAESGYRIGATT